LGGIPIDLAPPAGAMSAMTFFGCIRQIQINGFDLAKEFPFIHPNIKIMVFKHIFALFLIGKYLKYRKKLLKMPKNIYWFIFYNFIFYNCLENYPKPTNLIAIQ
jgi:hypothetical protein